MKSRRARTGGIEDQGARLGGSFLGTLVERDAKEWYTC